MVNLTSLTLENVFFGVFHGVEDFHVVNHIILLAKYYISNCKLNVIHPSLKVFIAKLKATCRLNKKSQLPTINWKDIIKNGTNFYLVLVNLVFW